MTEKSTSSRIAVFISEHNPLKIGFGRDRMLFLLLFIALVLLFIPEVAGFADDIGEKRMNIYNVFIPLGIIFVASVQAIYYFLTGEESRKRQKMISHNRSKFYKFSNFIFNFENKTGWVFIVIDVLLLGFGTILAISKGFSVADIINEFFIAMWEQSTFAIIGMTLLVNFFFYGKAAQEATNIRLTTFALAFLVVDFVFAFSHWWAYQAEWTTIMVLAVTGLAFMSTGYLVPSLGIVLHYTYNILVSL